MLRNQREALDFLAIVLVLLYFRISNALIGCNYPLQTLEACFHALLFGANHEPEPPPPPPPKQEPCCSTCMRITHEFILDDGNNDDDD